MAPGMFDGTGRALALLVVLAVALAFGAGRCTSGCRMPVRIEVVR